LVFCTGHHADGKDAAPVWSGPLPEDATLVVYMPGRDLGRIARELRAAGVAEDVACCAISHAATPRQSWVAARMDGLNGVECGPAPVLLLVGRAMQGLLDAAEVDVAALAVIDAATSEMREEG
jgi:uroporphyrin-III C-methyltransferase